ncbi:MAG: transglycosylase SLT domain-containing protein [bacterium]|nr:transglycosylase SLT domain-containing protein [bacterium]
MSARGEGEEGAIANTVKEDRSGISAGWPGEIQSVKEIIIASALANGLNPDLLAALIYRESWFPAEWREGYNLCPDGPVTGSCTSVSGAIGPSQVMPFHFSEKENPRDLVTNIARGAKILKNYTDGAGSTRGGLAAYNCGPHTENWLNSNGCWEYADYVLSNYEEKTKQ